MGLRFIKNLAAKIAAKKLKENKHMKKILDFAQQKKTYIMLAVNVVAGILASQGVVVPEWVWALLLGLTGIAYKAGANRTEQLVKELVDQVKKDVKPQG